LFTTQPDAPGAFIKRPSAVPVVVAAAIEMAWLATLAWLAWRT
jgi:hypothetical protein